MRGYPSKQPVPAAGEGGRKAFLNPAAIEAESMRQIDAALRDMGISAPEDEMSVIRRVIHTTADFDFAGNMYFSQGAVRKGREALLAGRTLVTDTNMALAGISRPSLQRFHNQALCFMADPGIAAQAQREGCTRAWAAMGRASSLFPDAVYVIGNAPTALLRLDELLGTGAFSPSLIIAVPVGFVNVVESKERIRRTCRAEGIPLIAAMGRKGGSTVAAAIVNALFYGIDALRKDCN